MALTLQTLAPAKGARSKKFRVGRGNASGRGTTAGRGTKGQRARTGGRKGLKLKGLRQMLLAFPKLRGFQSRAPKLVTIPLNRLAKSCQVGERIDLNLLKSKGLVVKSAQGVKVVGADKLEKALTIVNIPATASAKKAIEAAGGTLVTEKKKVIKK